jgi:transcriptional regulator with XRE-family HTH domain
LCYSPYSLIHSPNYSLKWRFKILTSCYEHNCQLLNICTHCGERILFNQFIPSVTRCPSCNRDLRTCKVQSLTEEMQQQSLECSRDLEFLLTPQPWEHTVDNLEQRLGQQLAHLRQKKGLPLNLVASELELHLWEIEHIEHVMYGYLGPARIKLQTYFKYAGYLGVTIPELFQGAFQQKVEQASPKGVLCDEDAFNRVQEAIQILKARSEKITQENICRQVQMNMPLLAKFPRTREFVKSKSSIIRLTPEERERVSAELLAQVQSAVKQLKESGQRITQIAIGKLIGRKPHEFRYYPQILEYFRYLGIVNPESEQYRLIVNSKRQRLMTSKLMK